MDGDTPITDDPLTEERPAIEAATTLFNALYEKEDLILLRGVETWTENGRKRTRIEVTKHRAASKLSLQMAVLQLLNAAVKGRLNLFFGVCPRFGGKGQYDKAWQIRVVRFLWCDIDNVTEEEARRRIAEAGLPPPTAIVSSGNGIHVYWRLEEPYLIDDVGDPPPIKFERNESARKNKWRQYIVEQGEKVYLDKCKHIHRLSAKAEHIQDVLAGIAKAIKADHTHDLARLLRIPGPPNRKDERNGREPMPTSLVECDPTRKYPLALFEPFKCASPDTERAKNVARMRLPKPRKISPSNADKLDELIAACSIAPVGTRSEADFAVCCFAIRKGIEIEEVWSQVKTVGKFADQGRPYFDRTWQNAEYEVRASIFEKVQKRTSPKGPIHPNHAVNESENCDGEADDGAEDRKGEGRPTIFVESATTPVADTLHKVTDRLLAAGNCFVRGDQLVVIDGQTILTVLSAPELAGLLNQHVEFYFMDEEDGEYKPLPAVYANTWLNHRGEFSRFPEIKLFTHNPVYSSDWRLIKPGFDAESGVYYAGPLIEARSGTEYLDALLQDFCFYEPADRTNYIGFLLTALLVPHFIGAKPMALFNGNQPGLGKSILSQIIAIFRDGRPVETASFNPNDEEFEKRIGAIVRRGTTTIIVDNAKSRGRKHRIESACLERSISDPILSYRLLGKSESIQAENSHIFCVTANTPDVGPDLVTRSVAINLHHEGDPRRRAFSIADPEGFAQNHRIELTGELIGMIEVWKACGMPRAKTHSRFNKRDWGNIVGGILEANGEPDFLVNMEAAAAQLDKTRREFAELVEVLAQSPQSNWTASELVEVCANQEVLGDEIGKGSSRSRATKMGTLAGRFIDERFDLSETLPFQPAHKRRRGRRRRPVNPRVRLPTAHRRGRRRCDCRGAHSLEGGSATRSRASSGPRRQGPD